MQNAFDIGFTVDLCIAFAIQILQHINEIIFSCIFHIFNTEFTDIFSGCFIIDKIIFINCFCQFRSIVDRSARNILRKCLCICRNIDRIWKLSLIDFVDLCIENKVFPCTLFVIIMCCDRVDFHIAEDCYHSHVSSNNRISINFCFGSLNNPLLKDLTCYERILWHRADRCAFVSEVL